MAYVQVLELKATGLWIHSFELPAAGVIECANGGEPFRRMKLETHWAIQMQTRMSRERLDVVRAGKTKSTSPTQAKGTPPGIIGWHRRRSLPHSATY